MANATEPLAPAADKGRRSVSGGMPGFGHFYILLAVLAVLALAAGFMAYAFHTRVGELEGQLADVHKTLREAQAKLSRELNARLAEGEAALDDTNKRLGGLSNSLQQDRAELVDHKTATDKRFADVTRSFEEQANALAEAKTEILDKLDVTRNELTKKQTEMAGIIAQIQDDSKYIIGELGKKAEKAYLRFMERKLKEEIGEVSVKVDDVKGTLQEAIQATANRIDLIMGTLDNTIKKKVEDHVKIDFVPSASDQEK
jgi:DNA anti-recombination protein RmuC